MSHCYVGFALSHNVVVDFNTKSSIVSVVYFILSTTGPEGKFIQITMLNHFWKQFTGLICLVS